MQQGRFVSPEVEDTISKLAQDEAGKRQYYRPVYSLHKWWARRPGALFRSIILSANRPEIELFKRTSAGSLSATGDYFESHNLDDVIILDPFMGGGTTLVEANRLGAKVVGCDLNPVAYWIARETLKPIDLAKLEHYFECLEQTAGEKVKSLYKTHCPVCKTQQDSLYVFWVRYVACPHCGEDAHLFKWTLLNNGLSRNKPPSRTNLATVFCPECFAINEWPGTGDCHCSTCGQPFDPLVGTYDQGFYTCSHCHTDKISLIQTLKRGQKLREKLVAIEFWCNGRKGRFYKSPDTEDIARLTRIEDCLKEMEGQLLIPQQEILPGASSVRWRQHNYRSYHEVFNARQLLAFNYLIQGIQAIPEEEYRFAFFTVLSNSLEYNNMMTPYNFPHRKLHHLFNYHAMPLTTTPVENAVWGVGAEGAGTFANCYQRYWRAKHYCQKPFDKFKDSGGVVQTVKSKTERVTANFVTSFEELQHTPRGTLLLCGDSAHLPSIPAGSVDFVITDPPYFDSIHYSELSNFFYVWLKSLVNREPFVAEHVPTEAEAIVNDGMDKGEAEYKALLAAVFQECERVLKNNGKLIFTFHHAKWRAWWTIWQALRESGFRVTDSFPVMSEYKVNPHIRNKQALDMDLVLVCQKQGVSGDPLNHQPAEVLRRAIQSMPNISSHSDNKLFLHFMGELLKTASSVHSEGVINYDWFSEALTHFDDFAATIERDKDELQYAVSPMRQLRLLESNDPI